MCHHAWARCQPRATGPGMAPPTVGLSLLHQLAVQTFPQGNLVQAVLQSRIRPPSRCVKLVTEQTRTAVDGRLQRITATSRDGVGIKLLPGSVKGRHGPLVSWALAEVLGFCGEPGVGLAFVSSELLRMEWSEMLLAAAAEDQRDLGS